MAAQEQTPTDAVKGIVLDLVQILANKEMKAPDRAADRLLRIETALRSHVSFEEMAKRSLGLPWGTLTKAEQQVFGNLFIQFLAHSVAGWSFDHALIEKHNEYFNRLVIYLSERREGKFSEVGTKIRSMKTDTQFDFRMVNQAGEWRVYDVIVDYVSVSDNYRAQFANILRPSSDIETPVKNPTPLLSLLETTLKRR